MPKGDLFFFFWRSLVFWGGKNPLNFGFRRKNLSQFQWRSFFFFFLKITCFWAAKPLWITDFGRKIRLNFSEDLFFCFGDHLFLGGKSVWIPTSPDKSVSMSDKPCEPDSRAMKIRVKVAYSCLTLSKKAPPLFQILATRLLTALHNCAESRVVFSVSLHCNLCNIKVCSNNQCIVFSILMFLTTGTQGLREGGSGGTSYPGPGARKSLGFHVKFWYRTITP